eukprot:12411592-Karenia_brevis.AAC.1
MLPTFYTPGSECAELQEAMKNLEAHGHAALLSRDGGVFSAEFVAELQVSMEAEIGEMLI